MSDNNSSISSTGGLTASISVSSSSITIPPHNSVSGVVSPTNHLIGTLGASGGGAGGGDKHFVYTQSTPSNRWVIHHGLNKFPAVTVVDSAESTVVGNCEYIDENNVILTFNGSFSGKAYFN